MVDDAEKYGESDKERKAAIEAANRADSVCPLERVVKG